MPTTDMKRPDDEDQSTPGRATTTQEETVAAPSNPTTPPTASTAVVERPNPALNAPVKNLDDAMAMAKALAYSNLVPKPLQGSPPNVMLVLMYGQELGLSPVQALQGIYVVNSRPSMSGQLWFSLIRRAGHRITVSEHTDQHCTVTITRGDSGEKHSETFTLDDAKRAGLTNKDVWKQWPKRMLLWRAGTSAATIICPEVAMGYDLQGAEFDETAQAKPSLAEVAANRGQTVPEPPAKAAADPVDVTDAEIVEETPPPPPPSADELAAMADAHQGGSTAGDGGFEFPAPAADDGGWPEVKKPGGGR